MEKKEFNNLKVTSLSDKIFDYENQLEGLVCVKDIKEFIKKLKVQVIQQIKKEEHCDGCDGYKESEECSTCKSHFDKIRGKIDKLAGKELI